MDDSCMKTLHMLVPPYRVLSARVVHGQHAAS